LKRLFLLSLLAGVALTVASAALVPLPRHIRFPSDIEVLTNGGRQESFQVRWPQDRIALPGELDGAFRVSGGGGVVLTSADEVASVELFRLRDDTGNVIGLASRSTAVFPGQRLVNASSSNWVLMIPSRGTLLLSQEDSANLSAGRSAEGFQLPAETAAFWAPGSRYRITAGPAPGGRGRVLGGSSEFRDLSGTFSEIWELNEISSDGRTEGRISLVTVTTGGP
jgi:hypothetical protein